MNGYFIIIDEETGRAGISKTKKAIYANTTLTAKELNILQKSTKNIEQIGNYTIIFESDYWKCGRGFKK